MVIAQALACNLPVICTNNSGGSELIKSGNNGYVIPIRDVSELKNKMNKLYQEPETILFLKKNIMFNENLSWNNYGDRIENIYKNLLKQH
jgi:glycosyltransferase involved in cell wall biosynthesis